MTTKIHYKLLTPEDFNAVIALGNHVHGDGYLTPENIQQWYEKGLCNTAASDNGNISFVAYHEQKLVGFRITFAPQFLTIDKWLSPEKWNCSADSVCYFKCNTVDQDYRGYGIGKQLLRHSIEAAKAQGAKAGVSHLWKQSPNNSAVAYFTKCGGVHIKSHPDKWNHDSKMGYDCILCGFDCHCEAAEMIIYFD